MPNQTTEDFIRQLEERMTLVELNRLSYPLDPTSRRVLADEIASIMRNKKDLRFEGNIVFGGFTTTISAKNSIQDAIDTLNYEGGGTIFLKEGTYTLIADITVPSGVTLQGVTRDDVIIDCNTSYKVQIAGSNGYETGTVTINNGDVTV